MHTHRRTHFRCSLRAPDVSRFAFYALLACTPVYSRYIPLLYIVVCSSVYSLRLLSCAFRLARQRIFFLLSLVFVENREDEVARAFSLSSPPFRKFFFSCLFIHTRRARESYGREHGRLAPSYFYVPANARAYNASLPRFCLRFLHFRNYMATGPHTHTTALCDSIC